MEAGSWSQHLCSVQSTPTALLHHAPREPSTPSTSVGGCLGSRANEGDLSISPWFQIQAVLGSLGCGDHIQHAAFSSPQEPPQLLLPTF